MRTLSHRTLLILAAAVALGGTLSPFSSRAQAPPASQEDAAKEEKMQFADTSGTDIKLFNQTISNKNKIKSLFFTQAEITDIHLAINTYLKNSGRGGDFTFDEEAFLNRLGRMKGSGATTAQSARFYTYPQFFLDSIVYDSPESWIIWVNGVKITQDTPKENSDIQVVAIDQDKVKLEWAPAVMDKVTEVWNQVPNDEIDVDTLRGRVSFTLRPNQTFSSYVMKVLEGRVLPVTVDTTLIRKNPVTSTEEIPVPPPPASAPATAEPPPASKGSDEGLSGLINSYKNMKTGDEK